MTVVRPRVREDLLSGTLVRFHLERGGYLLVPEREHEDNEEVVGDG